MFVHYSWYVVAWSEEVTDEPMHRAVLGEANVLSRRGRFAGRPVEPMRPPGVTTVRRQGRRRSHSCGYRGMEYDCSGRCVRARPGPDPAADGFDQYPWSRGTGGFRIWTGDPPMADPSAVPETHWTTDEACNLVTHARHLNLQRRAAVRNLGEESNTCSLVTPGTS